MQVIIQNPSDWRTRAQIIQERLDKLPKTVLLENNCDAADKLNGYVKVVVWCGLIMSELYVPNHTCVCELPKIVRRIQKHTTIIDGPHFWLNGRDIPPNILVHEGDVVTFSRFRY